jgi:hypothetical protein
MSPARPVFVSLSALIVLTLLPNSAFAGLNSGAQAKLRWQNGATGSALSSSDAVSPIVQLLITASGISSFRGADVQILFYGMGGSRPVPAAWQFQDGGCASGAAQFFVGGRGGTTYPNAFTSSPAVPGLIVTQNAAWVQAGDCLTPRNRGVLWLSAAGAAGKPRNSGREYALWAVNLDLRGTLSGGAADCSGDADDPAGPTSICLSAHERIPCEDQDHGAALLLLDDNNDVDVASYALSNSYLTWNQPGPDALCPYDGGAVRTTWGRMRKAYR